MATARRSAAAEEGVIDGHRKERAAESKGEKQKQTSEGRLRKAASGLTNSSQGEGTRRPSRSLTT